MNKTRWAIVMVVVAIAATMYHFMPAAPAKPEVPQNTIAVTMLMPSRAELARRYPDVAREVGLTEAETEALFQTLMKHETTAFHRGGSDEQMKEVLEREAAASAKKAVAKEEELRQLLGAARYAKWQEYLQTDAVRQASQRPPATPEATTR